jgi:hypothetical protein
VELIQPLRPLADLQESRCFVHCSSHSVPKIQQARREVAAGNVEPLRWMYSLLSTGSSDHWLLVVLR